MIRALGTFGRVLLWHAPSLVAWYLGGQLVHRYWIQLAGYVGGSSAAGGLLLMPVALMAQLVSYVAMFLVVRDALHTYRGIVPAGETPAQRRREFVDAVFVAILPFVAFYAAQGFLRRDMVMYDSVAWDEISYQNSQLWGETVGVDGRGLNLGITPLSLGLLVAAYLARWLWNRYDDRLPRWLTPVGLYFEAVWIYLAATTLFDLLALATTWIDTRVGAVWLTDIGTWFSVHLAFIAVVWNTVVTLIAQVFGIMAQPLAWLAVAGTVYGQAIAAQKIRFSPGGTRVRAARVRYRRTLSAGVRRRIDDLLSPLAGKFTPLWNAITLMFRAGPLLIAGYVFAYTVWKLAAGWFAILGQHAFGPQDDLGGWSAVVPLVTIGLAAVTEPLRIAIVASAYDSVLGGLRGPGLQNDDKGFPSRDVGQGEQVGAGGVLGNEERDERVEGRLP